MRTQEQKKRRNERDRSRRKDIRDFSGVSGERKSQSHIAFTARYRVETMTTLHKFLVANGVGDINTTPGVHRNAVDILVKIITDNYPECAGTGFYDSYQYLVNQGLLKEDLSGRDNNNIAKELRLDALSGVGGTQQGMPDKPLAYDPELVAKANAHRESAKDAQQLEAEKRIRDEARARQDLADMDEACLERFGMEYKRFAHLYPDLFSADGELISDVDARFREIGIRSTPPANLIAEPYSGPTNSGGSEGDALLAGLGCPGVIETTDD